MALIADHIPRSMKAACTRSFIVAARIEAARELTVEGDAPGESSAGGGPSRLGSTSGMSATRDRFAKGPATRVGRDRSTRLWLESSPLRDRDP